VKNSLKIILTILISIALGGIFAVLAFTNLFSLIETGLYYPIIARDIETTTSRYIKAALEYHRNNIENNFSVIVKKDYVWRAYYTNQTDEDIKGRKEAFDTLGKKFPGQFFVRLVGPQGKKIHYSTLESDIIEPRTPGKINYMDLNKADPTGVSLSVFTKAGENPKIILDYGADRFIYMLPVVDSLNDLLGTALFYVPADNLRLYLLNQLPGTVLKDVRIISAKGIIFDPSGLSLYAGKDTLENLKNELDGIWSGSFADTMTAVTLAATLDNQEVRLFYRQTEYGIYGTIIPLSQFTMSTTHKVVILIVFVCTTFLILFLIFNIRQDPQTIVAGRMRKFQIEFLREFLKSKEDMDLERWQHEMNARRAEIKKYMKQGLKKISESGEVKLDDYIMRSWDEVTSFLKGNIARSDVSKNELGRIEDLIKTALSQGNIVLSPEAASGKPKTGPAAKMPSREAEELEEAPELLEAQEHTEAEEAAGVEALEAAEGLEEIEEAEEIPEAETLEAAEGLEEVEEAEEIAEADALEPAEEAEEVTEIEALEGAEGLEEIEEVEEVSEAEALEPAEGLEGIEEVEEVSVAGEAVGVKQDKKAPLRSLEGEIMEALPELPVTTAKIPREEEEDWAVAQIREYIEQGKIICYSLEEVKREYENTGKNVIFDNGIYRIKEELYNKQQAKPVRKGLKALAEAVLTAERTKEEKGVVGIEHLIKIDESLSDFAADSGVGKTEPGKIFSRAVKRMPFTDTGLDMDEYFRQYNSGTGDKASVQAFGRLLKKMKSVCAAILTGRGNTYEVSFSIGLDDESKNAFMLPVDSPFVVNYLEPRMVLYIKQPLNGIHVFDDKLSKQDKKYVKHAILFPARFAGQNAYLFFGLTGRQEKKITEILKDIDVQFE
jgi:hypothetical protein